MFNIFKHIIKLGLVLSITINRLMFLVSGKRGPLEWLLPSSLAIDNDKITYN